MCAKRERTAGIRLTERDANLLLDIQNFRLLTTQQIAKLHFPSLKKAQKRLKRLYDAKLVERFPYPVLIKNGGKGEFIYRLTASGLREVVGPLLRLPQDDLPRPKQEPRFSYVKLEHHLTINWVWIYFLLATRKDTEIDLVGFFPEFWGEKSKGILARATQIGMTRDSVPAVCPALIPDGVLSLQKGTKKILLFLEVDLGTENIHSAHNQKLTVMDKVMRYTEYLAGGHFSVYNEVFDATFKGFRLLVVTARPGRIALIKKHCLKAGIPPFIWLTAFQHLSEETIFERIWHTLDRDEHHLQSLVKK